MPPASTRPRPTCRCGAARRSRAATRGRILLGRRVVIPGDNPTNAIDAAAGFVSTAADIARFFAQLSPNARTQRAVGREPARDDAPPLAQSA